MVVFYRFSGNIGVPHINFYVNKPQNTLPEVGYDDLFLCVYVLCILTVCSKIYSVVMTASSTDVFPAVSGWYSVAIDADVLYLYFSTVHGSVGTTVSDVYSFTNGVAVSQGGMMVYGPGTSFFVL